MPTLHPYNTNDTFGQHLNLAHHRRLDEIEIHIVNFIHDHPLRPNDTTIRRTRERKGTEVMNQCQASRSWKK